MKLTEEQREERAKRLSESMKEKWDTERDDMLKAYRAEERYKNCEHKQLESKEARAAYMREYQRKFRESHPDHYKRVATLTRLPKQISLWETRLADENWRRKHTIEFIEKIVKKVEDYKKQLEELNNG